MFRNKKLIIFAAIVLFAFAVVLSARIHKPKAGKEVTLKILSTQQTSTVIAARHGPGLRFTLYDAGIFPRRARVKQGPVVISIEDFSGGTSGLLIRRSDAGLLSTVASVQLIQNQWRGQLEVQLDAGDYELLMADRPMNRAHLMVEP